VQRLTKPSGPVPSDCDTSSTVAAAPRLDVSQIPETAPVALPPVAPPSTSLRNLLRETRAAADRGDREAFRSALAAVKATLRAYPAGAEKRAAEDTVRVYDDLDRVWTYQYESPTGAFFDESSDVYKVLAAYPGYGEAIRRQTLTVGGRRLYPATESRRFLVAQASGQRVPSDQRSAISDQRPSKPRTSRTPTADTPALRTATHHTPTPTPRTPAHAPKVTASKTPAPAPQPVPAPQPAPAPAPAPTPVTPAPVTTTTASASTETTAPAPTTTTSAPPTTAPALPSATDTAVAATESVEPPVPQAPQKGRGMVVPVVLILIGLGVLVVLFRASSS
jgi:hypothetical protein